MRDGAPDAALHGAVVAMGNFDGVHRGHQAVIAAAQQRAEALGKPAAVLTFEPHPRSFFVPDEPLFRLTDEAAKLRLLASTGLDGAIVLTFDAALAGLTADEFVTRILLGRFGISGAVIGFNFHFGKNRAGSPDFLAAEGRKFGFTVDVIAAVRAQRPSGVIRPDPRRARGRRPEEAATLLGFPWFISGEVIHGDKRGRDLGFPTANLSLDLACGLRHGVYAVRVAVGDRLYDGVANFGRRPMFDTRRGAARGVPVRLSGDLYGKPIDVAFIAWIREEKFFGSLDELVQAINEDSAARAGNAQPRPACLSADPRCLISIRRFRRAVGDFPAATARRESPTSTTGTRRSQPNERPACMATPNIFGSSSHDDEA